ncbi:hypothetical protein VNO78_30887 [Psophocarpus tetragonolobus]|uniref:Uncharacterized protein n=1 Tax=Psophocarpus tetragonolobus TaxID=3891 RepID=A0AAN9RXX8_PSOTE
MPNLRLLTFQSPNEDTGITNSVLLPNGLQFLPKNLRYLGWNGYPLDSLPSSFCPEKLVELSMPFSNVERLWHGVQNFPNLERIELRGSKNLIECPKLAHAPNLRYVSMRDCESLSYVDPSIFFLLKLEILNVAGCKSLRSLNSNSWPQSLKVLFLAHSGVNELPPSILNIRNLHMFSFLISYDLTDLPNNFVDQISLSESREPEYNIFLLSSLKCLSFRYSAIISLPESFKYLPRLKLLEIGKCKMLQHVPALPPSIQLFYVWNCQSLQTVLSSTVESSKKPNCTFLVPNYIKLDEHSYDAIFVRIELGTKPSSAVVSENEEEASLDNEGGDFYFFQLARHDKICYCLSARRGKVQKWFHSHYTQAVVTVELPRNVKCYLETSQDEKIKIPSFFVEANILSSLEPPFGFMADHLFYGMMHNVARR